MAGEKRKTLVELAVEALGKGERLDKFFERLAELESRVEDLEKKNGGKK